MPVVCTYRLPSPVNKCAGIGPSSFPPINQAPFPLRRQLARSLAVSRVLACVAVPVMMTPTNVLPKELSFASSLWTQPSPSSRERERETHTHTHTHTHSLESDSKRTWVLLCSSCLSFCIISQPSLGPSSSESKRKRKKQEKVKT